jgi:hypothetical protein
MPAGRASIDARLRLPRIVPSSYATSSGPKQREQTYDGPTGYARPQPRQRSSVTRDRGAGREPVGDGPTAGAGEVASDIGGLRALIDSRSRTLAGRPACTTESRGPSSAREGPLRLTYLAGGPARTWHLAWTLTRPAGCRGFIGPVPPPLLISVFSCGRSVRASLPGVNGLVTSPHVRVPTSVGGLRHLAETPAAQPIQQVPAMQARGLFSCLVADDIRVERVPVRARQQRRSG